MKTRLGSIYKLDGEPYILAQVDYRKIAFIGIATGNRWKDPVLVKNANELTEIEINNAIYVDKNIPAEIDGNVVFNWGVIC